MKMLLIDDDAVFIGVLARSLQRRGCTVSTAQDAATALALAAAGQPERVVLDLRLDRENGLALIEPLLQCCPAVRIVVLTGYSSIATAVKAVQLGAVNYLCKPADADEILAAFHAQADMVPAVDAVLPSVNRLEWEHIQSVLDRNNGNISATARALGMHRRTLQRKLQKKPVGR